MTNPTKDFFLKSEAEISYSYKPDRVKVKTEVGYESSDKLKYKYSYYKEGNKYNEWDITYDKKSGRVEGEVIHKDREAQFEIDNIKNPRNAKWGLRYGPKSYKFSAVRVPHESIAVKLDSSENSRLKEVLILN